MRCSIANENVGLPLVASSLSPAQPISRVTTVHSNFSRAPEGEWLAERLLGGLFYSPG